MAGIKGIVYTKSPNIFRFPEWKKDTFYPGASYVATEQSDGSFKYWVSVVDVPRDYGHTPDSDQDVRTPIADPWEDGNRYWKPAWTTVVDGDSEYKVNEWDKGHAYDSDDLVAYGGNIYRAITQHNDVNTTPDKDETNWELFSSGGGTAGPWKPQTDYKKGDFVSHDGKIWLTDLDFTSADAFDSDNWTLMAPYNDSDIRADFDSDLKVLDSDVEVLKSRDVYDSDFVSENYNDAIDSRTADTTVTQIIPTVHRPSDNQLYREGSYEIVLLANGKPLYPPSAFMAYSTLNDETFVIGHDGVLIIKVPGDQTEIIDGDKKYKRIDPPSEHKVTLLLDDNSFTTFEDNIPMHGYIAENIAGGLENEDIEIDTFKELASVVSNNSIRIVELAGSLHEIDSDIRANIDSDLKDLDSDLRHKIDSDLADKVNKLDSDIRSDIDSDLKQKLTELDSDIRSSIDSDLKSGDSDLLTWVINNAAVNKSGAWVADKDYDDNELITTSITLDTKYDGDEDKFEWFLHINGVKIRRDDFVVQIGPTGVVSLTLTNTLVDKDDTIYLEYNDRDPENFDSKSVTFGT
ncbi:MAG: hypothetical protein N0C84_01105 [Candidatus Thiodiazotropha taylori]|uniref:Uncharacterized protein n=1 Tax=Candidatus Thiodiazotropha taylori TaxID=2792791 RepID=A0A9E4K9G2_9GAMM|nr:hypothetical protein [Candidatus Thiodiazotropha taylori]MCW4255044.1 hypothetical protein [Candidatus Thiodiazotropha taylori]